MKVGAFPLVFLWTLCCFVCILNNACFQTSESARGEYENHKSPGVKRRMKKGGKSPGNRSSDEEVIKGEVDRKNASNIRKNKKFKDERDGQNKSKTLKSVRKRTESGKSDKGQKREPGVRIYIPKRN